MGVFDTLRVDGLITQAVESSSPDAQDKALNKLKKIGKSAIPKIADRLQTTNKNEAAKVERLLGELIDDKTLDYFVPLLSHESVLIRQGVTNALSESRDFNPTPLVNLLNNPQASKPAIMQILTAHKDSLNATNLIRFLYQLEQSDQVALFRIIDSVSNDTIVPELVNRLDSKSDFVRAQLTKLLAKFDQPTVHHALQGMLNDKSKNVRLAALDGLARMHGEMDIETLCTLIDDGDFAVQNKAVETIVALKHPTTVRHLIPHLKNDSEHTRRAAVEVLNEIASRDSVRDLFHTLKDEDWWVRSRAADALGKIGGPKVVQAVVALLKDKDEFVRRSAIEIINATKDERTYNALVDALNDSDWWVRERAVDGLAELGNKQAVPLLVKLLQRNEEDDALAIILIKALRKLGAKSATPYIIRQLWKKDDNVVHEAIQCLEDLADDSNLEEIISSIEHALENRGEETKELGAEVVERVLRSHDSDRSYVRSAIKTRSRSASSTQQNELPGTIIRGRDELIPKKVDPTALEPDDILAGRYKYIRQVGKGAFGSVYLMEDIMIEEQVILKFLHAQFASDDSVIKRFIYELRFARKVTHHNVIRIYDLITFGDSSAISMEYFQSHTLSAELKEREPLDITRAIRFATDVCNGMESAHAAQVIHRDLKPNNILINDEDVLKIVDFGIAAASQSSDEKLTKTGLLVGTPTYMSPEQVLGNEVDEKTDIYSLGVIMYEMLTGRAPYSGKDSMSIMYQHVQGQAPRPIEKNPQVPIELSDLVMDCMQVKPPDRVQSMAELKERLSPFQ